MKSKRRFLNRRTFLTGTILTGVGGVWAAMSSAWGARFLRARLAEIGRPVRPADHQPEPGRWSDNAITLAWLGHACVLINSGTIAPPSRRSRWPTRRGRDSSSRCIIRPSS